MDIAEAAVARTRVSAQCRRLACRSPYLLFLGDTVEPGYAKTAFGLRDWAPERCIGEFALPGATVTTGLPQLSPAEAHAARRAGAGDRRRQRRAGCIPHALAAGLLDALDAGLDIVVRHAREACRHSRSWRPPPTRSAGGLIDVRVPPADIPIATGAQAQRASGC